MTATEASHLQRPEGAPAVAVHDPRAVDALLPHAEHAAQADLVELAHHLRLLVDLVLLLHLPQLVGDDGQEQLHHKQRPDLSCMA